MKTKILGLLVLGLLAGLMTAAHATVVVHAGVNNVDTYTVLLNAATDAQTVTGTFGLDNRQVNFASNSGSGLLNADPTGQGTISGGTGNEAFAHLLFSLTNNDPFTRAVFNINAAADGDVTILVEDNFGGAFSNSFSVAANSENFFTVSSIDSQFIKFITLTGLFGTTFEDVRQVRLGMVGVPSPVPEPGTLALLCLGLAGIGLSRRRRAD